MSESLSRRNTGVPIEILNLHILDDQMNKKNKVPSLHDKIEALNLKIGESVVHLIEQGFQPTHILLGWKHLLLIDEDAQAKGSGIVEVKTPQGKTLKVLPSSYPEEIQAIDEGKNNALAVAYRFAAQASKPASILQTSSQLDDNKKEKNHDT